MVADSSPKAFSYIRFSTPDQLKGDSLRRQLQSSREYAESRGLILDETLSMRDLGLSAYHGEHRTKGALGKFLELVDTGEIPKGSTLIVESLAHGCAEEFTKIHSQEHPLAGKKKTLFSFMRKGSCSDHDDLIRFVKNIVS
jgi:DNA invertase Pin-like site-specific DNA recombinase